MKMRSVILTGAASWTVPPGVTAGWVNGCAAGGAGQAHSTDGATGGSGSGAGEFCIRMPVALTPGTILSLTPGTPGLGGSGSSPPSTTGTGASFLGFNLLPGGSCANANGSQTTGNAGPRGGATSAIPQTDGVAGGSESPTAYGGASGGVGEGLSVAQSGAGGQQIGQWAAPRTPNAGGGHPGGGGGCGVFGGGGFGADGTSSSLTGGQAGTGYGSGSSGMAGNQTTQATANGQGGILMLFYYQ